MPSSSELSAELSQGRWIVIADTLDPPGARPQARWQPMIDFLIAAASAWRSLLRLTAGATVLSLGVAWLLPATYTATTQLLPPQPASSSLSGLLGQFGDLASFAGKDLVKNPSALFVALLRSRSVADQVISRTDLMRVYGEKRLSDCRERLGKATDIEATKEGVIVIQVQDREAARASVMANAYVAALIQLNQTLAVGEAARRRAFFESQVAQVREKLGRAEEAFQHAQETTGIFQPDAQAKAALEVSAALRAHIALQQAQLEKIALYATANSPEFREAQTEIAALQAQLRRAERQPGMAGSFALQDLPAAEREYLARLRDLKYYEAVFEMLSKQLEAARIDEAKEGVLIQVIDPATVPDRRSGPHRSLLTAGGGLAGFCLGLAWIGLREKLRRARADAVQGPQLARLRALLHPRHDRSLSTPQA
jgi:uncharacterized protein involved in exopolysaccharide biosynthesis